MEARLFRQEIPLIIHSGALPCVGSRRGQHHDRQGQRHEGHPQHGVPIVGGQQPPGCERAHCHRAEDDEIVKGLHPGFFFRAMAFQHQRGSPHETEVPADSQQDQRQPEAGDVDPGEADGRG
ncbi:hypothetical protein D9M70_635780 [compost metagenome]